MEDRAHISYSLNSLKGAYVGGLYRGVSGVIKLDTRTRILDYGSYYGSPKQMYRTRAEALNNKRTCCSSTLTLNPNPNPKPFMLLSSLRGHSPQGLPPRRHCKQGAKHRPMQLQLAS